MEVKIKRCKAPTAPFDQKFLKTVPMVDAEGKPIPWNPEFTSFWKKPKTTATIMRKKFAKIKRHNT